MRGNQSIYGDNKVFFVKVGGLKKGQEVFLSQQQREKDGKYTDLENIYTVSGRIIKAEATKYEFEGRDIHGIKIYLEDPAVKEVVVLECGMNSVGRNIINTLAWCPDLKDTFKFSVYTNKKGYPAIFILQDGIQTQWKYPVETINSKIITNHLRKAGQDVEEKDYFELDQWLLRVFKDEVIPKVQVKQITGQTEIQASVAPEIDDAEPLITPLDDPSESLPF